MCVHTLPGLPAHILRLDKDTGGANLLWAKARAGEVQGGWIFNKTQQYIGLRIQTLESEAWLLLAWWKEDLVK